MRSDTRECGNTRSNKAHIRKRNLLLLSIDNYQTIIINLFSPTFKPRSSPDNLVHNLYVCSLQALKKSTLSMQ